MSGLCIDSSGWLEYFVDGQHAKTYRKYLESRQPVRTPSLVLFEVYKKITRERSETDGLLAITQIVERSEAIVPLDERLALFAADVSLQWKLAMADAIIYASALHHKATLITSDRHFEGLDGVVLV